MNSTSWRHHYLPVFYLKGFTNSNDRLFIYDVTRQQFVKNGKEFSPNSYFFKKNANSWIENGEIDDFLEVKFFKPFDDRIAKVLDIIRSSDASNRFSVSEKDMPLLQNFVNLMFWRLPHRSTLINQMIDDEGLAAFAIKVYKKGNIQDEETRQIEERTARNFEFRKTLHLVMSMIDTFKMIQCRTPLTIQRYSFTHPKICSDNPVLIEYEDNPRMFQDDFVFPISGNMHFIRAKRTSGFSENFKIMIDTLIYKQAIKYVSFSEISYQEILHRYFHMNFKSVDELRDKIFGYLKYTT